MPRYVVLDVVTPMRFVPSTAWGEGTFFKDLMELEFDFLVTDILVRITKLALSFLPPTDGFAQRAITLADSGNHVLEELKGT